MSKITSTLIEMGANFARPTRFSAEIALPAALGSQHSKMLDILCKEVQVPEVTNDPIDMSFKGHVIKIPGRTNQTLTVEVTFYLDENHQLREIFHHWVNAMDNRYYAVDAEATKTMSSSREWFGEMYLKARDFEETKETKNYFFESIFPTNVSGPSFGSSAVGEISEITVTFAYYRFRAGDVTSDFDGHDEWVSG